MKAGELTDNQIGVTRRAAVAAEPTLRSQFGETLASALNRHRGIGPGFHALRHVLALAILTHHCRVATFGVHFDDTYAKGAALTISAAERLSSAHLVVELLRPALFALVGMFFALSGFLVAGSALRTMNMRVFFANRALRILPALSVEVLLSAFVLGPLVTSMALSQYFSDGRFFRYFGNIVGEVTFQLPGVFAANPWPATVNANLWTLPAEFWCYFLMLGLMASGLLIRRRQRRWMQIGIVAAAILWMALDVLDPSEFTIRSGATHFTPAYIVVIFLFGVLFFINSDRIILHPLLFAASGLAYYLLTLYNVLGPLSGVFLTYCTVYLGMMPFPSIDRLIRVDLSYGTYLYGFPITQATIFRLLPFMAGWSAVARLGLVLPIVIVLTVAFSWVSWTCIEKPALALRRRLIREPSPLV
jgi:peptidoglycan/LPS O-acetylase OafA/YrhL